MYILTTLANTDGLLPGFIVEAQIPIAAPLTPRVVNR